MLIQAVFILVETLVVLCQLIQDCLFNERLAQYRLTFWLLFLQKSSLLLALSAFLILFAACFRLFAIRYRSSIDLFELLVNRLKADRNR